MKRSEQYINYILSNNATLAETASYFNVTYNNVATTLCHIYKKNENIKEMINIIFKERRKINHNRPTNCGRHKLIDDTPIGVDSLDDYPGEYKYVKFYNYILTNNLIINKASKRLNIHVNTLYDYIKSLDVNGYDVDKLCKILKFKYKKRLKYNTQKYLLVADYIIDNKVNTKEVLEKFNISNSNLKNLLRSLKCNNKAKYRIVARRLNLKN